MHSSRTIMMLSRPHGFIAATLSIASGSEQATATYSQSPSWNALKRVEPVAGLSLFTRTKPVCQGTPAAAAPAGSPQNPAMRGIAKSAPYGSAPLPPFSILHSAFSIPHVFRRSRMENENACGRYRSLPSASFTWHCRVTR